METCFGLPRTVVSVFKEMQSHWSQHLSWHISGDSEYTKVTLVWQHSTAESKSRETSPEPQASSDSPEHRKKTGNGSPKQSSRSSSRETSPPLKKWPNRKLPDKPVSSSIQTPQKSSPTRERVSPPMDSYSPNTSEGYPNFYEDDIPESDTSHIISQHERGHDSEHNHSHGHKDIYRQTVPPHDDPSSPFFEGSRDSMQTASDEYCLPSHCRELGVNHESQDLYYEYGDCVQRQSYGDTMRAQYAETGRHLPNGDPYCNSKDSRYYEPGLDTVPQRNTPAMPETYAGVRVGSQPEHYQQHATASIHQHTRPNVGSVPSESVHPEHIQQSFAVPVSQHQRSAPSPEMGHNTTPPPAQRTTPPHWNEASYIEEETSEPEEEEPSTYFEVDPAVRNFHFDIVALDTKSEGLRAKLGKIMFYYDRRTKFITMVKPEDDNYKSHLKALNRAQPLSEDRLSSAFDEDHQIFKSRAMKELGNHAN